MDSQSLALSLVQSRPKGRGFKPSFLVKKGLCLCLLYLWIWPWGTHRSLAATTAPSAPPASTSPALTPIRLQLKWKHQFQFAGYYAAKEKGYYRQRGLEVSFLEAQDNQEPAQTVLEGKAEFGVGNSGLLLLRGRGQPVVALAVIYQHSPYILLALKRSGIENIHQLVGRRVMLEPHSDELVAYLKKEGISLAQLDLEPFRFDPTALIRGAVDAVSAYATDEPFFLRKRGAPYLEFNPRAGGIDFYGDTLFTSEAVLRQDPQLVKAFREASLQGWAYALENPAEIIDLILKKYGARHSREHLAFEAAASRKLIMADVVPIGYMNPGRWRGIAAIYQELGLLNQEVNLETFLYDPNPPPPWRWIYGGLASSLLLLLLISWVAWRFYRLQKSLRRENQERIIVEGELRAAEKRFRLLTEHTPFPVLISQLDVGAILYANPKTLSQFAISWEVLQTRSTGSFYVDSEERERLKIQLLQQGYLQDEEARLQKANGEIFWARISAALIEFDEAPAALVALIDVTEQYKIREHLARLAITDELTNVYNRRYFFQEGEKEYQRAKRYSTPLSLLMIDIDHFKTINDAYGHETGDQVLQHFAQLLKCSLRESDLLARLGGEEFGILLPQIDLDGALQLGERIRRLTEESSLVKDAQTVSLTASIGVSSLANQHGQIQDLLREADAALYRAKGTGRNRVQTALANESPKVKDF